MAKYRDDKAVRRKPVPTDASAIVQRSIPEEEVVVVAVEASGVSQEGLA